MDTDCNILKIPSEIRVLIYQFLFNLDLWNIPRLAGAYDHEAGSCDLNLHNGKIYTRRKWSATAFRNFTGILRTCRLINHEAMDVLFEQTIFHMRISDEQYNRRMRPYAPIDECAFLPRVQQINLNPDVRRHEDLIALPRTLNDIFRFLTCSPSKTMVHFEVSNASLSDLTAMARVTEILPDKIRWEGFLEKMSALKPRCRFFIKKQGLRNNVEERFVELMRAVDGDQYYVPYILFEGQ